MPLYEFTCKKCGHNFEELMTQTEKNDGKTQCPACKSTRLEQGFSSFATGSDSPGGSLAGGGGGCGSGGFT